MAAVIESGLSPRGLEGLELIPERYRLPLLEYRGRPESAQDDVRQGDEFLPRKRPKSGNLGDALTLALEQRILQADDFWPRRPITLPKQAFATSGTGCRGEWGTERKLRNADSAVAPFAADE